MAVDITIPVPWGNIRALQFGNTAGLPWLGLHGWLDNAHTWVNLAPHLPDNVCLVALDLPGHGQSDPLPAGVHYHDVEYVAHIHRAVTYLGWTRFTMLGHSMGGGLAALYTAAFPAMVSSLVMLDMVSYTPRLLPGTWPSITHRLRNTINKQEQLEEKLVTRGEVVYQTVEQAVQKMLQVKHFILNEIEKKYFQYSNAFSMNEKCVRTLIERGLRRTEG